MNKKVKKKFTLVANWKMNPDSLKEAKLLTSTFERKIKKSKRISVIICPPTPFISFLVGNGKKSVKFGSQDVDFQESGSFTGGVSARQIKEVGASYSIIGHSERRKAGDTDAIVADKVIQALNVGLRIILCVGEDKRDQNAEYLLSVKSQLFSALSKIDKNKFKLITVAYEPVWAVGKSYSTALSPRDIHEMSIFIKKTIAEIFGKDTGLKTEVLYGGSINLENAQPILSEGEIDGLLIGRQSLDIDAFSGIIDYANNL